MTRNPVEKDRPVKSSGRVGGGESRGGFRWSALAMLALLLALPPAAGVGVLPAELGKVFGGVAAALSVFTFLIYFSDKRSAERKEWRTPENLLHFLELI